MSGGKETPRQKMIGIMYLVLTALLALNVSKEILNAFVIVEDGLNATNTNFDGKNGVLYAKFEKQMADNPGKAKPFYDKAKIVRQSAKDLCKIVDDIRSDLYLKVQGLPNKQVADTFKLKQLDSKDNYDIPTHYMLGPEPEAPKEPEAHSIPLKNALIKYKKDLTAMVPEKDRATLKLGLNTDDVYSYSDEKKVSWEFNNFDHTTMAATMCILSGIKNDIKNAESDVVNTLLKAITANDFSFDAVEAKVVSESDYVTAGEEYKADIFVSAHNSAQDPEVLIGKVDESDSKHPKILGNGEKVSVSQGVGKYTVKTSSQGDQEYSGVINVKGPGGEITSYPFQHKYKVAAPSYSVAATKMNVFYIGVDNPVTISVGGTSPNDIIPGLTGATGSIVSAGKPGEYIVKVKDGTKCDINVSVKQKDGAKSMGKQEFRVKHVPKPNAKFAGVVGDGPATTGELNTAGGVVADMPDFAFDLKFPILSWNMSVNINGLFVDKAAVGPSITADQKALLQKCKKGGRILIEDVYVTAPEGKMKIPGCSIKVK